MMNRTRLKAMLVRHEGLRLKPYRDTVGKLTIGVGRNLDDCGISNEEAAVLLDNDITRVWQELTKKLPFFGALSADRQNALVDMAFNLGLAALLPPGKAFYKMLAAMEHADFEGAAREMLSSAWARQVGDRAGELAGIMLRGEA